MFNTQLENHRFKATLLYGSLLGATAPWVSETSLKVTTALFPLEQFCTLQVNTVFINIRALKCPVPFWGHSVGSSGVKHCWLSTDCSCKTILFKAVGQTTNSLLCVNSAFRTNATVVKQTVHCRLMIWSKGCSSVVEEEKKVTWWTLWSRNSPSALLIESS